MDSNKKLSITLIACGIGGALIGKWLISGFFPTQDEKQTKALIQAANSINANLPMQIDSETLLFSTTGSKNNFAYNYELINVTRAALDKDAFENIMRPNITNAVCTTDDMKTFRDMEITVTYRYYDSNREQVSQIDVDTTKCKITI